jgi:hypothetical protein
VDRVGRQPVLVDQVVGGHIPFVQSVPEGSIGNHSPNPSNGCLPYGIMVYLLTMLNILSILEVYYSRKDDVA